MILQGILRGISPHTHESKTLLAFFKALAHPVPRTLGLQPQVQPVPPMLGSVGCVVLANPGDKVWRIRSILIFLINDETEKILGACEPALHIPPSCDSSLFRMLKSILLGDFFRNDFHVLNKIPCLVKFHRYR